MFTLNPVIQLSDVGLTSWSEGHLKRNTNGQVENVAMYLVGHLQENGAAAVFTKHDLEQVSTQNMLLLEKEGWSYGYTME